MDIHHNQVIKKSQRAHSCVQGTGKQIRPAERMGAGQQTNTAEGRPQKRVHIAVLGDLVHRDPLRAHGTQQPIDAFVLLHAGKNIRHLSDGKPRHSPGAGCQLHTLVHDAHALPRPVAAIADQLPQKRCLTASRRPRNQRRVGMGPQIFNRIRLDVLRLPRDPKIDRREIPKGADPLRAANGLSANAEAVSPRQGHKSLPQLCTGSIGAVPGRTVDDFPDAF